MEYHSPPKDGSVFFSCCEIPMRWHPYKRASQQFKKGIKGRWQEHNGYGWTNSDRDPTKFDWRAAEQLPQPATIDLQGEVTSVISSLLAQGTPVDLIYDGKVIHSFKPTNQKG